MRSHSISIASQGLNRANESKYSSIYHPKNNSMDQISCPVLKSQDEYQKLINRLEMVANEHPFAKQKLLLIPEKIQRGYLHQGCFQYFKVPVKGQRGPLRVAITNSTSKLESFVSLKHEFPCERANEFKFNTFSYKVNSPGGVFVQSFCYIAIKPYGDCKFEITCSFKSGKRASISLKQLKSKQLHNEHSEMKSNFDHFKTRKDMKFLKNNMSVDKMRPKSYEEQMSMIQKRFTHYSLVLQRKKEHYNARREMLIAKSQYNSIEQKMQRKASQYSNIMRRKEIFGKNWMIILYLSLGLVNLKTRFDEKTKNLQVSISTFMSAWRVQRNFKVNYLNHFPIKTRFLARSRNLLTLFFLFSKPLFCLRNSNILGKYFYCVSVTANPRDSFQKLYNSAKIIKCAWNNYQRRFSDVFDDINILWDFVVAEILAHKGKGRRKRSDGTLNLIPTGIKNQIILEYIEEVKGKLSEDILKGNKLVMLKYWPSDEKITSLIYSANQLYLIRRRKRTKK